MTPTNWQPLAAGVVALVAGAGIVAVFRLDRRQAVQLRRRGVLVEATVVNVKHEYVPPHLVTHLVVQFTAPDGREVRGVIGEVRGSGAVPVGARLAVVHLPEDPAVLKPAAELERPAGGWALLVLAGACFVGAVGALVDAFR